jgi:hypothetical protein
VVTKNCEGNRFLTSENVLAFAAIYRQQKVLSHFPVCCWIDLLLMIKNCLIESRPPCMSVCFVLVISFVVCRRFVFLMNFENNFVTVTLVVLVSCDDICHDVTCRHILPWHIAIIQGTDCQNDQIHLQLA